MPSAMQQQKNKINEKGAKTWVKWPENLELSNNYYNIVKRLSIAP